MTDSAKTPVLLRKHSILNVYERGSACLDQKKIYCGGKGGSQTYAYVKKEWVSIKRPSTHCYIMKV